jgi:site-specific DNA-methyltransferase (adenine-specific)
MTRDAIARTVRRKTNPTHWSKISEGHFTSEDGGPRLQRSVLRVRSCQGDAEHPTQKPVGIVAPLIEYSSPRRGLVLDPFMGSGTTLRTAKDLGRRAVGIELDERYSEIAARRMSQSVLALEVRG